ncbi:MAG: Abi family protein [Hominimerdicola sp.]
MALKELPQAMSIDEQVNNLKSLGLIINDESYAKKFLNDVSYFRLIKAYSLGLKSKNSNYFSDITFDHIVELYLFNANFRQLLFAQIERVEVNLRCRIANYFSSTYGVLSYESADNFANPEYHKEFLSDINAELDRNSKSPFVRNFHENYIDGKLPLYALIELFSFGTLSKFFKNMKNQDKKAVALTYGVGYTYLESWFEHIAFVRNICAHYGRLYNVNLVKTPMLYKQYLEQNISNNKVFATLLCLKRLIPDDKHWNEFLNNVEILLSKSKNVNKNLIGFPENWKTLLEQNIEHNRQLITL